MTTDHSPLVVELTAEARYIEDAKIRSMVLRAASALSAADRLAAEQAAVIEKVRKLRDETYRTATDTDYIYVTVSLRNLDAALVPSVVPEPSQAPAGEAEEP